MTSSLLNKDKILTGIAVILIILIFLFGTPYIESFLGGFPAPNRSITDVDMLMVKVVISAPILVFLNLLIGPFGYSEEKKIFKYMSEARLPKELKYSLIDEIDDFAPPPRKIIDLLDLIKVDRFHLPRHVASSRIKTKKFYLRTIKEGFLDVPDFATKTYYTAMLMNLLIPTRKHISHYSITKTTGGYLETFFSENKLKVSLNDSLLGYFDYNSNDLCDANNQVKGSFGIGSKISARIAGLTLTTGTESSVFIDENKIANVVIVPSSDKKLKKNNEAMKGNEKGSMRLFQNLNVKSDWEAYMLLGFGIAEYAFARTSFGK
ncbi:hypothetical protein [uncultured Methanolobus sp.]|uniref:hypothetical protein n=1 Tax=uncultured Methanolobus sp. TaxID=218300 RepID=UPI002AAAEFEF|nr:hypothetical protein [uncultured Methanolobus sp.]